MPLVYEIRAFWEDAAVGNGTGREGSARYFLTRRLETQHRWLGRYGDAFALLLIDIDHFKNVNDTLGHAVGDELLIEVSNRLRAAVRRGDLVSRFGGDEFLLLVASHDIEAEVGRIHQRIKLTVSEPIAIGGTSVRVTATLGVSLFPRDGSDFETLLRSADLAMYSAKEGGRDALAFYEASMTHALRARTALESDLRLALEQRAFEVHYQPRVSVASHRIVGAEALVRWRHPTRGMIPPGEFIPLAEEAGSVEPDELMLEPQSMLDTEVTSNPVPPMFDDTVDSPEPPRRRWLVGDAEEAPRAAPAAGGTLFERMSNIARGSAKADVAPTEASDPLDIPRFLNRQNNQ